MKLNHSQSKSLLRMLGINVRRGSSKQLIGTCPFCGKVNHLYINEETLLWDCKRCGKVGNLKKLIGLLMPSWKENLTSNIDLLKRLVKNRGLKPETLLAWGVGWNGRYYTIPTLSLIHI